MQWCSALIAVLTGALAKAQIELTNPQKSPLGRIESQRGKAVRGNSAMRHCPAG